MEKKKLLSLLLLSFSLIFMVSTLLADELEEGTYVVNPNGTGDFTSLEEVIEILNEEGITGPVVIKLAAGTHLGPYTLNKVRGTSTTNTITFTSLDAAPTAILTRTSMSGTSRSVFELLGTKNVIFENLTIKISVTSDAWGINIRNKADNIVIRGCTFNCTDTSNLFIVAVNSNSSIYTEGQSVENLLVEGNNFNGGYMSVVVMGKSDYHLKGIKITNNKITGSTHTALNLTYLNSYEVIGNVIEMSPDGNTSGSGVKINSTSGKFSFIGNRIFKAQRYGVLYGGHSNPSGMSIIANNMIGGGFTYAYNQGWTVAFDVTAAINNVAFYYNSIYLDTPGTTLSFTTSFRLHSGSSNVRMVNNSFSYEVGEQGKNNFSYGLYIANKDSIVEMDYNNYHVNISNFMYYGAVVGNLATLQTIGQNNFNSRVGNPQYIGAYDLHSYAAQLSGVGTPIAAITHDIDGDERHSTNPCIGADEYIPMFDRDLSVIGLSGTPLTKVGTPEIFEVTVKNEGRIWQTEYSIYLIDQKTNKTLASLDVDEVIWSEQENTHQLTWIPEVKGIHQLYALVSLTGDENHNNDRFPVAPTTLNVMVQELTELPSPTVQITANFANQSAVLSWAPVIGAKSYKVYATADPYSVNWPLYTTTTNTFLNVDLGAENLFFRVIASNTAAALGTIE
jgi:hypothetical protein